MALLMRLRGGKHSSDLFKCGHVFVTRNPTFVRESRKYCLERRLINARQEGPVIHQRELATAAWLRTGLGAAEQIPRGHLMAICERVLRVRMEVRDAVAAKLREITPDKIEQFELLLQNQRSLRKLGDETLNDESVVTAENAERLLEAMKKAAIAEERGEFERKLKDQQTQHRLAQRRARAETAQAVTERDAASAALAARLAADEALVGSFIERISLHARRLERALTALLLLMGALAIVQYFTSLFSTSRMWTAVLAIAGGIGLYDFIMTRLERPKIGIPSILNLYCRWSLRRRLAAANIPNVSVNDFDFNGSKITRRKFD